VQAFASPIVWNNPQYTGNPQRKTSTMKLIGIWKEQWYLLISILSKNRAISLKKKPNFLSNSEEQRTGMSWQCKEAPCHILQSERIVSVELHLRRRDDVRMSADRTKVELISQSDPKNVFTPTGYQNSTHRSILATIDNVPQGWYHCQATAFAESTQVLEAYAECTLQVIATAGNDPQCAKLILNPYMKTVNLEIKLLGGHNQPLASMPYLLKVGPTSFQGTTDENGFLKNDVPAGFSKGRLQILDREISLQIADLMPAFTKQGATDRLMNLGFCYPATEKFSDDAFKQVLFVFQRKNGLEETGNLDPATIKQLKEAYGH
jgi:hypothetical protein